jgi:TolB-like protein
LKTFFSELKDRNVVRVGAVYLGTAWLITHVGTILGENFEFPHWVMRSVIVFLALGFPVALGIAWVYEATPEGLKRTSEVEPGRSVAHVTGRKLDRVIIAVLVLVVAALIADRFLLHEPLPGRLVLPWSGEATVYGTAIVIGVVALLAATLIFTRIGRKRRATEAAAPAVETLAPASVALAQADDRVSLAVLPFADMSPGKDQEYFSDGLSEELLNQLAQMKGLRVAARTSCFAFKGQNPDLKLVSEKLGVAHVLEGSVRKAGNRLRITAQLINAADGYHLWSNTFDRELDDVFAIQEDIARAVAEALKITLGMNKSTLLPGGTRNIEAYDLYLRAQALGRQSNAQSFQRAIALLREAVELDPRFAMGWATLAVIYINSVIFSPETAAESRKLSLEAFERAKACAPDAAQIHGLEATQLMLGNRDWIHAQKAWDRARALSSDATWDIHPFFLACVGRTGDAVKGYQKLVRADPLMANQMYQFALDSAGRYEEADTDYKRALALPADPAVTEYFALLRTMAREGSQTVKLQFRRYLALNDGYMPIHKEVLEKFDDKQAVLEVLRKAFGEPFYQDTSHMDGLAQLAAYFGDDDLALACLRRGYIEMRGVTVAAIWHPNFASLRKTEGFKALVRDLGLYDYWRQTGHWPDFARAKGDDDFEIIK